MRVCACLVRYFSCGVVVLQWKDLAINSKEIERAKYIIGHSLAEDTALSLLFLLVVFFWGGRVES